MQSKVALTLGSLLLTVLVARPPTVHSAERQGADVKSTILEIADRWVGQWLDKEWDEAKGSFKFRHGPYSDAFEHHYVAAVLINTPESKFHRHEALTQRVVSDLVYHSKVFVEQCRDQGLRGYWQKAMARSDLSDFDQVRFFDYWRGLGRVAVKTERYQASCYPHWAWTWDFATDGGVLFRLNTPGRFSLGGRTESGRCWLDWDPHRDPETGGGRGGLVVAITKGGEKLSFQPGFPDEAIVTGSPEGRLYGFTKQELVDVALFMPPRGDPKRIPHRVEAWRGHLPRQVQKGDVFTADFAYVPHDAKANLRVLVDKRVDSFAAAPHDAKTEPKTRVVSLLVHRSEQVHGVVVQAEPRVVIAAAMPTGSTSQRSGVSPSQRISVADLEGAAELFAAEIVDGQVRKACLDGESLDPGTRAVARLSRPAVVTILPGEGRSLVDAGVGPIELTTMQKTHRLFSANHEFPRRANLALPLAGRPPAAAGRAVTDVPVGCQRFASLPARLEVATRMAELEMLEQSAAARRMPTAQVRDLIAAARHALAAGDMAQARSVSAKAQQAVLALHESAEHEHKPVVAINTRSAVTALLPPKIGGQDRFESDWENALLKYLHPTDQLWLAVRRLEAATQLIGD